MMPVFFMKIRAIVPIMTYNQLTRQERQNAKGETMSVRYHYPYEDAYEDTQLINYP